VTSIAREVVERLRVVEPERRVEVVIEDALVAEADPGLVRVLLENLLGNAWKFTSKKASARIELGRSAEPGRVVYFVRDDGAGFDMTYAKRLFAPFQRLHSSNDFEGTGIGLATAQRIVRRHGGKIWAEGTPGAGATFFFTLGEEHAA
ncbi:MAG TPA: ATP-binding protein, partial [Labilithrix sp.]